MTIQLRDYQEKAVKDVRQAYKEGFKAPFLTAPTGAGKTVMLAEICASASIKKHTQFY